MENTHEGADRPAPKDGLAHSDISAEAAAPEATPHADAPGPAPQARKRPRMGKRAWALCILAAGILLTLFFSGDRLVGQIAFHEGKRALKRGDYATAIPCFFKAQGCAEEADSYLSYA